MKVVSNVINYNKTKNYNRSIYKYPRIQRDLLNRAILSPV